VRADELEIGRFLRLSEDEGQISLHGRRQIFLDVDALGRLRKEIVGSLGSDRGRTVLTRFGFACGYRDAKWLRDLHPWDSDGEWFLAGFRLLTIEGMGQARVIRLEMDRGAGTFLCEAECEQSYEAEQHLFHVGASDHPVCWTLTGYLSGYASAYFGDEVHFLEEVCAGAGSQRCRVVGRTVAEWGDAIRSHLRYLEESNVGAELTLAHDELAEANKRLEQTLHDLQAQYANLRVINEMNHQVMQETEVDRLLENALRLLIAHMHSAGGIAYLHDEASGNLRLQAAVSMPDEILELVRVQRVHPEAETMAARAAARRQMVIVDDLHESPIFLDLKTASLAAGFHSLVSIPLCAGPRLVGVLTLVASRPRHFASHEMGTLQILANELAIGVRSVQSRLELVEANRDLERQKAIAEEANRAKSGFLAKMSHELRTPLNAIIGFSQILEDNLAGELDAEASRLALFINQSGTNLLRLINDILDLTRIEAGRLELTPAPTDLRTVIARSCEFVRLQAERKGLEVRTSIDPAVPPCLVLDGDKLQQVLVNLLGNAVKFTDTGRIELSARVRRDPARLILSARDTGIGIAPEHHLTIFEEFRQVEPMGRRSLGGAGLGLAISRRLVELMGGTIRIESVPGEGSTFTVDLPLEESRPAVA
jgi:signal transduction histidine kinase